jgi:hypothetical protein
MTAVDAQEALKRAVAALKAGDKAEARRLLDSVLAADRHNEQAWLWMSGVVDSDGERIICLENVLTLNPYNERARHGLEQLGRQPPPVPIAPLVHPASGAPALTHLNARATLPVSNPTAVAVPPPRPEVADYRLYITLVIILSLVLMCTVAAIVVAVVFFAPGA